jgi:hypothetical protein
VFNKRALIGGGITVFIADLGFAVSGYPSLVTSRPSILWIIGALALGSIVVGCFMPKGGRRDPLPSPMPQSNNQQTIGNVAGGSAIGNQVTVNVQPVSAFSPAEASQATAKSTEVDQSPAIPKLRLSFVQAKGLHEDGVFRFDPSGFLSLSILVVNLAAAQGEFAADAHSVFAVIAFTGSTGKHTNIGRACWMGHHANEITIPIGDSAHIFVGFPQERDEWLSYYNPNRHGSQAVEQGHPLDRVEPRRIDWYDGETLEVDIRIVSSTSTSRGQTLAHRQFLLTRNGIAYNAKWKES